MVVLERQCLALMEEVEHSNEKQEHLATLMESKMNVQKVAPADFQRQIFQESKTAGGAEDRMRWNSYKGRSS